MLLVPASQLAKNFGEWRDRALSEPVVITQHGRENVVMVSAESYQRLIDNYREITDVVALEEAVAHSITDSQIPPEYRWDIDDEATGPFGRKP